MTAQRLQESTDKSIDFRINENNVSSHAMLFKNASSKSIS